ncbi:MAG: hypothetical protein FWG33_04950, partial [Oscillospiraceae bacterium]|nr:hypothetical protein [Oscillospiraceae bacterium]
AASWITGNNGTVLIEVLGENGVVLKLGQQEYTTVGCVNGPGGRECKLIVCKICNKDNAFKLSGDTNGDGKVDIFDCLEILKYLVKMKCTITHGSDKITIAQAEKAGIISKQGFDKNEPQIFCVLEILKYMVKMTSEITAEHFVPGSRI